MEKGCRGKQPKKKTENLSRGPECFLPPHAGKSRWEKEEKKRKKRRWREREKEDGVLCVHTTTEVLGIGQVSGDEGGGESFSNFQSKLASDPDLFALTPFIFSPVLPSTLSIIFSTLIYLRFRGFSPALQSDPDNHLCSTVYTLHSTLQSRLVNKLSAARGGQSPTIRCMYTAVHGGL